MVGGFCRFYSRRKRAETVGADFETVKIAVAAMAPWTSLHGIIRQHASYTRH